MCRTYDPASNEGIEYEDAMEDIHAIKKDGTIVKGVACPAYNKLTSHDLIGDADACAQLP
jgi:hypothetical protein